jgi:hypothetical protein
MSILSGAAYRRTSAAAALSAVKQADLEANLCNSSFSAECVSYLHKIMCNLYVCYHNFCLQFDKFCYLVGIATGYGLDARGGGSSSPGRVKNFHFSILSRPALGSTQPPIKLVPGALSRG